LAKIKLLQESYYSDIRALKILPFLPSSMANFLQLLLPQLLDQRVLSLEISH
jgi:hypothetical protein